MKTVNTTRTAIIDTPRTVLPFRTILTPLFILLSVALLLSGGKAANAQLSFLIQPTTQSGYPGDLLNYSGTVTNTGASEVFLNSSIFNLNGVGLALDDSPFFTNFPFSLTGGQTFTGELFTVQIGPTVVPGLYSGTFTIQGGPTDTDFNNLATQNFSVGVGAAPEPASGLLLLLSGVIGTAARLRQRRVKATIA
jgi:hypothetical protein